MKIKPKYTIPIIWIIIIFCTLMSVGCSKPKEEKNPSNLELIGKALGTIVK